MSETGSKAIPLTIVGDAAPSLVPGVKQVAGGSGTEHGESTPMFTIGSFCFRSPDARFA